MFVMRGGKPIRQSPLYFVFGDSPHWERLSDNALRVPLSSFHPDIISFTFSDSFYTFSDTTLRGIPIPATPHRCTVYMKQELFRIIDELGLPRGYSNPDEEFELYIEAQVWDDSPLQHHM